MQMTRQPKLDDYYHPIPFDEYRPMTAKRMDCKARYDDIKNSIGNCTGKTMLDFGCAEGYFMFRFAMDGGKLAQGVEVINKRREFIQKLAEIHNLPVRCSELYKPSLTYDILLYLDLYETEMRPTNLDTLVKFSNIAFISPCRNGHSMNLPLQTALEKLYVNVVGIYTGYEHRTIFMCTDKK